MRALEAVTYLVLVAAVLCSEHLVHHSTHTVANYTISGLGKGCKHHVQYFTNPVVKFPMCTGQTDQDQKNGMSIINLIHSRGYLPTCRIMQLMLWMASEVSDNHALQKDYFVDVGANIGKCFLIILTLL